MRKKYCCFCGDERPRNWRDLEWMGCQVNNGKWHYRCTKPECAEQEIMKHAAAYECDGASCKQNIEGLGICTTTKN